MKLKWTVEQIETAYFLFAKRKVRPNYLILFQCFTISTTGFPIQTGHLFVPDGETPPGIIEEKLSLNELFAKFFRTGSSGLVLSPFFAALLLFFAGKETLAKKSFTKLHKNLTVDVLFSKNLQFDALTDLCAELSLRLENSIFANHETTRLDMKKLTEEISKKYEFSEDKDDKKDVKIKSDTETILYTSPKRKNGTDVIKTIPYVSLKRENVIDDKETIAYASPKREVEDEIDKKIYKEPKLETAVEIEKQTAEREKKIIKSELEQDKVDIQVSRGSDVKKEEEPLNVENFFIDDNHIFEDEEISNADRTFIIDLINRSNLLPMLKNSLKNQMSQKMEKLRRKSKYRLTMMKREKIQALKIVSWKK